MPSELKDAKPRRMHGIVPTPFEIPPEHRPVESKPTKEPLFVRLLCALLVLRAAVNLLLAMVPWSDPDSALASFLLAHHEVTFSVLPKAFFPADVTPDGAPGAFFQALPFVFLGFGAMYLFSAWKLWNLDKFWVSLIRWGMMFQCGATVVKILINLSARFVGGSEAPLSSLTQAALVLVIAWNVILFLCFACYLNVDDAYDSNA